MKKYRVKIDMPNFEKGEILEYENGVYKNKYSWVERPIDYPDCFEEIKDPLFVTDDGFEIYDPNFLVFGVSKEGFAEDFEIPIKEAQKYRNWLYFSTQAAAEKWIDENKPVFSKKQIRDKIEFNTSLNDKDLVYKHDLLRYLGLQ